MTAHPNGSLTIEVVGVDRDLATGQLPTDLLDLLYEVLYAEYGVARQADWLHAADGGVFLVARGAGDTLLGAARLLPPDAADDAN